MKKIEDLESTSRVLASLDYLSNVREHFIKEQISVIRPKLAPMRQTRYRV